jgi:hypothetical protein
MSLFRVYRLNSAGLAKAEEIATVFDEALAKLEAICGSDGREMAIVRTHLQTACFFAKH